MKLSVQKLLWSPLVPKMVEKMKSAKNTTFIFQAQLKQREGEIVQLQMEVSGLERVKEGLTQELGRLTQRSDQMHQLQDELQQLRNAYSATEQKYQTMLTVKYSINLKTILL